MEQSLPLMLRARVKDNPDLVIQYHKDREGKYRSTTYLRFYEEMSFVGAGLLEIGVRRGDKIGLIADNRQEWMITDFGVLSIGAVDVPRGCDITVQELTYILSFTGCKVTFAENQKQVLKIISCKKDIPLLETIICYDPVDKDTESAASTAGVNVIYFASLIALGEKREKMQPGAVDTEMDKGSGDDTATIIFTSGTTGEPKGVMISHSNFLCQLPAFILYFELKPGDIWLSMLPVWHVYERCIEYTIFCFSTSIAYSKTIASVLIEDFQAIRPQWMVSVPRVWEAIMEAINRNVRNKGGFAKKLFDLAVTISMMYTYFKDMTFALLPNFHGRVRALDSAIGFFPWLALLPFRGLAQLIVFNQIKNGLGGRFKAGISGGGSLPAKVDIFFNSIGIRLQEAYGLTETSPLISVRQYKHSRRGTIGQPLPGTEVKIADNNGRSLPPGRNGIIYAKGPQVMKGYYQKPEATAAVLSEDGWFNTGDIGMLTHNNELRITGRAKDTIVLRGGENVEPVPIECKLRESQYIQQCMIAGQDQKYLAAIIIPWQQTIMDYAEENTIPIIDYELLLKQPEINELIASEISERINLRNGFKPHERVYKFKLLPKPFETGKELSAKGELLRHRINALYGKEIHRLFSLND
ncbi:MAG: long-chain fatty acid--CoA ligase [Treponema sp.]|jgi:long-chain acyl-CoA synthetase|nr:long-chain fatty acid--CoA ligase [Treponema sp.]